ncbi:hypothetical protein M378DRAFT_164447 [Amanita muscaria Koide BX008]|uniref:Phospholipase C/P1 nuclease n=1 Tax=Amanita muscaria (strain Koide BX008) TaxID=946122 RepID=A0A0C2WPI2_AMAMK|nr:hypothetical protein M378DRAFT_164447 [Amanita muscaria Koide BX008]
MRLFPCTLLLANLVPSALAWGAAGHEIVATIAQIHLHPSALPLICSILNYTSPNPDGPQCHLAPVATWADRARFRMRWSAPLHYVGAIGDHPSETCLFPGTQGWAGHKDQNVLGAIRNVTGLLDEFVKNQRKGIHAGKEELAMANEALKFLIHFMGDMHQPLHLTGRDRGGNGDKVLFDGRQTNLHSVWDSYLIAKAIRTTPRKYNHPLADERVEYSLRGTVYDPYLRQIMAEGVLKNWTHEIPDWLSCPTPKGALATPQGQQRIFSWGWLISDRDPAADTDDETLCPYSWAKEIHALNCEVVWPKELDQESWRSSSEAGHEHFYSVDDELALISNQGASVDDLVKPKGLELDTPKYAGVIAKRRLIERLLAQAGVRLANELNLLFAEDDNTI